MGWFTNTLDSIFNRTDPDAEHRNYMMARGYTAAGVAMGDPSSRYLQQEWDHFHEGRDPGNDGERDQFAIWASERPGPEVVAAMEQVMEDRHLDREAEEAYAAEQAEWHAHAYGPDGQYGPAFQEAEIRSEAAYDAADRWRLERDPEALANDPVPFTPTPEGEGEAEYADVQDRNADVEAAWAKARDLAVQYDPRHVGPDAITMEEIYGAYQDANRVTMDDLQAPELTTRDISRDVVRVQAGEDWVPPEGYVPIGPDTAPVPTPAEVLGDLKENGWDAVEKYNIDQINEALDYGAEMRSDGGRVLDPEPPSPTSADLDRENDAASHDFDMDWDEADRLDQEHDEEQGRMDGPEYDEEATHSAQARYEALSDRESAEPGSVPPAEIEEARNAAETDRVERDLRAEREAHFDEGPEGYPTVGSVMDDGPHGNAEAAWYPDQCRAQESEQDARDYAQCETEYQEDRVAAQQAEIEAERAEDAEAMEEGPGPKDPEVEPDVNGMDPAGYDPGIREAENNAELQGRTVPEHEVAVSGDSQPYVASTRGVEDGPFVLSPEPPQREGAE